MTQVIRNKIEHMIDNLNKTICMLKIKDKEENKSILDEILGELDEKRKLVKKADETQLGLIEAELKYYTYNTNIYVTQATRYKIEELIDNLKKTIHMVEKKENKFILDVIIGNLDEKRKLVKKANDTELDIIETELQDVKSYFENKFENKITEAETVVKFKERAEQKARKTREKAKEKAKIEVKEKAERRAKAETEVKTRAEAEAKTRAEWKAKEEARVKEIALEEAILKAKIKEKAEEKAEAKIKEKADRIAQVLANKKAKAEEKTFAKVNRNQKKK